MRNDYANQVDASGGIATSLRTMNQTRSLNTTPGWDDVTGLGTPRAPFLSIISH